MLAFQIRRLPLSGRSLQGLCAGLCLALFAAFLSTAQAGAPEPTHGVAMHGVPLLPPDFAHFPYADPDAKKGGRLRLGLPGTFDSLNPFNLKAGSTAQGLAGNVFQTLMMRSQDEPFTFY
ncbi:MAG: ABC transporter substrate-binding protein, partial [Methylocystis sp.]